jgi:hypothetical protein
MSGWRGTAFEDWSNGSLWVRGRFELRIIDILIAGGFLFCCAYYGFTAGWQGAIAGAVMYVVLSALAMMVRA